MIFVDEIIKTTPMKDLEKIFSEEILIHLDAVLTYAYRLTRSRVNAEDLAQDVMVRARAKVGQFEPGTNGKAWVMKITFHTFVNDYNRKAKKDKITDVLDEVGLSKIPTGGLNDLSLSELDLSDLVYHVGDKLYLALSKLSREKFFILLLTADGFKNEEVADIVGIAEGTVKSSLNRMRKMIQGELKGGVEQCTDADWSDDSHDHTTLTKRIGNRRSDISAKPTGDKI